MYGTPSISIGRRMPCQWMVVGSSSLLVKRTRSHSPCFSPQLHAGALAAIGQRRTDLQFSGGRSVRKCNPAPPGDRQPEARAAGSEPDHASLRGRRVLVYG